MKTKKPVKCPYKKWTQYRACSALANRGKEACLKCLKLKNVLKKLGIDIKAVLKL